MYEASVKVEDINSMYFILFSTLACVKWGVIYAAVGLFGSIMDGYYNYTGQFHCDREVRGQSNCSEY